MVKPWPREKTGTEEDSPGSLASSMKALEFLYDESVGNGNPDITLILAEALDCGQRLIAEGQEISYESKDSLFCLFFLRAILGLHPAKMRHLVALLEWLQIVPAREKKNATIAEAERKLREAQDGEPYKYDFPRAERILKTMDVLRGEAEARHIEEIVTMIDASFNLLATTYDCVLRFQMTKLAGNEMVQ